MSQLARYYRRKAGRTAVLAFQFGGNINIFWPTADIVIICGLWWNITAKSGINGFYTVILDTVGSSDGNAGNSSCYRLLK